MVPGGSDQTTAFRIVKLAGLPAQLVEPGRALFAAELWEENFPPAGTRLLRPKAEQLHPFLEQLLRL